MKKKILFWTLGVILLVIVISLVLLPGIIRRYAVKHSKELVGRQIELANLRVNYFTGKILMTDFILFEANGEDEFVSFDTLLIRLKPFKLLKDEFVMDRFYISGLSAKVIQYDSTFNFDDLVAFHSSEGDSAVTDTTSSSSFKFHLSNIEFKHSQLEFDNRSLGDTKMLSDISFFIPYIGWNQSEKSEAGLRFSFRDEGFFESSINVDPVGGDFDAKIVINNLQLDSFRAYTTDYININELRGQLNCMVDIAGNINAAEKSIVSGTVEVNDFMMSDTKSKEFLGAAKVDCRLQSIDYYNNSYIIDSLIFTQPYVYFELDTATNNFFEIFNITFDEEESDFTEEVTNQDTDPSLFYAINHLVIRRGVMDYRDNLTGEAFDYSLSEIEMHTDSILSTSDWLNIYSTMLLNNRGKLVAEVGLDPSNPYEIILDYTITGFQLSDLNIYSRFYMGFPVLYGDMYYRSHTEIIKNQLTSENKLIIQHAELGEKSGGLYDLPVKFALFLLKDRKGVIDLDIPVRGDLNDPTVSIGKIVWNTFKNLIVKIATAPFDFLARVISADPSDIKAIEYDYLDTTFTAKRQHQIDLLLELEQKKGGLVIELVYFNDVEKEKDQIAINEAGKIFMAKTGKDYMKDEDEFIEFLKVEAKSDSLEILDASKVIIPATALDSLADLFANTRRNSLENYLRATSDSTQIQFINPDPRSPKNVGSFPQFEIKYSMSSEQLEKR
ncbi:MAG: DUF748 domain-containing protein [Bacteroidales bacterium]|nr:DUF748 domain-containing protein [Bacteroidales bacterium]